MTSFIKGVFRFFFGCAMLFFTAFCWQIVCGSLIEPAFGLAEISYVKIFAVLFIIQNAMVPPVMAIVMCFNINTLREKWSTGEFVFASLGIGFFHLLVALLAMAYGYLFF